MNVKKIVIIFGLLGATISFMGLSCSNEPCKDLSQEDCKKTDECTWKESSSYETGRCEEAEK